MHRVPPNLPPQFLEPAGLGWGSFLASDGDRLRWARLGAGSSAANCVLVGGFSECLEKYFETIAGLAERGLAVWFLEWRGQGGSTRPRLRPNRPEARDYERDATDLARFAQAIDRGGKPRVVIGHSMGAAIALLAMRRHPGLFDAAVLSAPMLALDTARIPWRLARIVAATAVGLRFGHAVVPGTRTWPVEPEASPDRSKTSGDPVRCRVQATWFAERPELRVDGVTFAWLGTALDLCRRFEDERLLAGIATPVLIGSAGIDHFVDPDAHRRAASIIPSCRHAAFPHAKHELFMESDGIRNRWFAEIEGFLADVGCAYSSARGERSLATRNIRANAR
jgi:lysophospholipase